MDLLPIEIGLMNDLPVLNRPLWPNIEKAMKQFAAQEAKSYAAWLSHQVYAGRTAAKLWADYEKEVLDQVPK